MAKREIADPTSNLRTGIHKRTRRFDQNYTLDKLLNASWHDESLLMQRSNIHPIITRIQIQSEAEEYALLVNRHDDLYLQGYIMDDYLRKPKIFDASGWQQNHLFLNFTFEPT